MDLGCFFSLERRSDCPCQSGGKEVSFEATFKLFGIGKSLTSKDKKIIFNVYCYLANREKEENAERPKKEKKK